MKIPRTIVSSVEKHISKRKKDHRIVVIYGPRQSGKTTLVKYLLTKHPDAAEYFNCDFPDVREQFSYERTPQIANAVKGLKLIILDEAQRIENIGLVLKILADQHPETQVIATGSSSFDLSNKISEPLTGRKMVFKIFPLSFEECFGRLSKIEQQRGIEHFLRFGGYPGLIDDSEKEAEQKLLEISESYLFKDIFTFQDLRKPELLTKLLRLLAFQIGQEVSFHELAQQLGVDQTVIQRYLFLLEEAFVVFRLGAFHRNLRTVIRKSQKIYFWDLGIRNAVIQNFNSLTLRNDIGALWENFCAAERLKYLGNHQRQANAYFWRTYASKEIDYIEEVGGRLTAFEFKWNTTKKIRYPSDFASAYHGTAFTVIHPENVADFVMKT
ncbi:ATP-binding protein [Candidatus Peregrinibacteria bacterium]|nr:ATP-binding protein [Candidatus Peregrinibacteria bacterium]